MIPSRHKSLLPYFASFIPTRFARPSTAMTVTGLTPSWLKLFIYRRMLCLDRVVAHFPKIGCFRPLKGSFSAWEKLNNGLFTGGVIAEFQSMGSCPTGSITDLAGMNQHSHQPWPVFWVRADDARLVGSMLHWRDTNDRLCNEGVFHSNQRMRLSEDRILAQIIVPNATRLPGAWISIASNWANGRNYFHWITDGLTRLLVREHLPEETRILLPANCPAYITETIKMLGLSHLAQTAPSVCIAPERFYFCSPTSMTGVWNPLGYNWLRAKFTMFRADKSNGPPIFLTRRNCTRVPDNLAEIEALFSQHGFDIVDCGKLSVTEQIWIASSASAIAGIHGASMSNLLWAQASIPVLEIFDSSYLNACYEQIAFQGNLKYTAYILETSDLLEKIQTWLHKAERTHLTQS